MGAVEVIILHPLPASDASPLEHGLAAARAELAAQNRSAFLAAGASPVRIVTTAPDGRPFGARVRALLADRAPGAGLVLMGSGALPLATRADVAAFVAAAGADDRLALANNRFSADVVAVSGSALPVLADLPVDFPADNALPRWLDEVAGVRVTDLRSRWRLAVDLDSPLDVILVGRVLRGPRAGALPNPADRGAVERIEDRCRAIRRVLANPRAELVVAGRTSATTIGWLERRARCRVRVLVEERGLRASSRLALGSPASGSDRPPRSVLGMVLERDGPDALGERLAELGDAALVDSRVLLADRLGADEMRWPPAGDRFASDLLDPEPIGDAWLAALTAAAAGARIPVMLGGHSLVGPGVRLIAQGR
jgi:hypothetical protein